MENSNIDYNVQDNHYRHFMERFSEAQAKKYNKRGEDAQEILFLRSFFILISKNLQPMRNIYKQCNSGRDSGQTILPDALRVNANLFQTDLCRNPEAKDGMLRLHR